MPIVDLQQRYRELGRIRLGRKSEKGYPQKLETFRLTSPERKYLDKAATIFGGTVKPWRSPAGDQWELITDVNEIPVIVPAQDLAGRQYYELWGSPGQGRSVTCLRRCDGQWEQITGEKCRCNPENRECKPTTHLQVIIKTLPDIGVWRATSHGFNVAAELPASVHTLGTLMRFGAQVDALLVTAQRSATDSEGQKRNFRVLELRIPHTTDELMAALPPETDRGQFIAALTAGPQVEVEVGRPELPPTPAAASLPAQVDPVSVPDTIEDDSSPPDVLEVDSASAFDDAVEVLAEEWKVPPVDDEDGPDEAGVPETTERRASSLTVREQVELDLAKLKGTDRWDKLIELVNDPPSEKAVMDDWRYFIRMVFGLMEKLGLWKPGREADSLHLVLEQTYGVAHLGDMRKNLLVELGQSTARNAKEKVDGLNYGSED